VFAREGTAVRAIFEIRVNLKASLSCTNGETNEAVLQRAVSGSGVVGDTQPNKNHQNDTGWQKRIGKSEETESIIEEGWRRMVARAPLCRK